MQQTNLCILSVTNTHDELKICGSITAEDTIILCASLLTDLSHVTCETVDNLLEIVKEVSQTMTKREVKLLDN